MALASGHVFGLGLMISDMVDPARVLAFLDLFEALDPTLIYVLASAVAVSFIAWRVAERQNASLLGRGLPVAPAGGVDRNLVCGALLFGMGWGLVGICTGPALVALTASGAPGFLIFFMAMLEGMAIWSLQESVRSSV